MKYLIFLCGFISGCSTLPVNISKIHDGDTSEKVVQALGKPQDIVREEDPNFYDLIYRNGPDKCLIKMKLENPSDLVETTYCEEYQHSDSRQMKKIFRAFGMLLSGAGRAATNQNTITCTSYNYGYGGIQTTCR